DRDPPPAHDHSPRVDPHDHSSLVDPHEHGSCPHCVASPSGAPAAPEHVACAALDGATEASHFAALQWDAKLPAVSAAILAVPDQVSSAARPVDRYGGASTPSVSLHLRHCVFLI